MGESPRLIPCSDVVFGIRMRKTIAIAALAASLTLPTLPLPAATASEFYASLLRRGVAAYDSRRFDEAAQHLRYAAFGYVDSIEAYQTAQIYLALTHERLEEQDRAREAVRRVLQAERIERRYARVAVPAAVRTAFEKIAATVLTPAELAGLRGTSGLPPAQPVPSTLRTTTPGTASRPVSPPPVRSTATTTTTTATTQPPVTVDRVEVEVTRPSQPQASQQPATTQAPSTQQPRPAQTQPAQTQPAQTQPAQSQPARSQPVQTPQNTQRGTNDNPTTTPAQPRPATTTTTPSTTAQPRPAAVTPPATPTTYTASELAARLASAERALTTSSLTEARRIYRELLASTNSADHATAVRIAEGFYRARDFAGALAAFERAGALRRGEEPYRYYVAVALYETGQYERARRELAAALPYIEVTADVERYRLKIQSANQ
jgi:tetratricopeptide (TPR) repeat protein